MQAVLHEETESESQPVVVALAWCACFVVAQLCQMANQT